MKYAKTQLLLAALVTTTSALAAQEFNFNIDPAKTWTDGYARIRLNTQGSFVGNYDPVKDLLGTRTKPGTGLFTSLSQNDPVPAAPFYDMGHAALVRTAGTFHLSVNTANNTVTLTNYQCDRVPQANLSLSATVALNNVAFRSASPNAVYTANQAPQSLGLIHVDMFNVTQRAGARTGTMVKLNDGSYRVSVTFMADAQVRVAEFGQFAPMMFSVPYSLVGNLKINGMSAVFGYPRGVGGESMTRDVDVTIQPMPVRFGPGDGLQGNYMVQTTVKTLGIDISGVRQMVAVSL